METILVHGLTFEVHSPYRWRLVGNDIWVEWNDFLESWVVDAPCEAVRRN